MALALAVQALAITPLQAPASESTSTKADEFAAVLLLLAQRQHGEVGFVERQYLSLLDRPLVSSGQLFYDAPNRLEKRTLKPRPESVLYDNGVIRVRRGRRETVLDTQRYPQILPLIESVRATLAGDRAALEKVFQTHFEGDRQRWVLTLIPRSAELSSLVAQIHIAGSSDSLQSVEVRQADGDRSVLSIEPLPAP